MELIERLLGMTNLTGRPIQPKERIELEPGHPRGCSCRSCIGRRNRRKGQQKQREARKALGITPQFHGQGGNEETWTESPLLPGMRFEVKSGRQIPAWVMNAIGQVEASRAYVGSYFKPALVLSPVGTSDQYLMVKLSDLLELAQAWQETGHGSEIKTLARQAKKALDEIERLS